MRLCDRLLEEHKEAPLNTATSLQKPVRLDFTVKYYELEALLQQHGGACLLGSDAAAFFRSWQDYQRSNHAHILSWQFGSFSDFVSRSCQLLACEEASEQALQKSLHERVSDSQPGFIAVNQHNLDPAQLAKLAGFLKSLDGPVRLLIWSDAKGVEQLKNSDFAFCCQAVYQVGAAKAAALQKPKQAMRPLPISLALVALAGFGYLSYHLSQSLGTDDKPLVPSAAVAEAVEKAQSAEVAQPPEVAEQKVEEPSVTDGERELAQSEQPAEPSPVVPQEQSTAAEVAAVDTQSQPPVSGVAAEDGSEALVAEQSSAPEPQTEPQPAAEVQQPVAEVTPDELITQRIDSWIAAWSNQDVAGYIDSYIAGYTPAGKTNSSWQKNRQSRLTKPEWIKVSRSDLMIEVSGEKASVAFSLDYAKPGYADRTKKRLELQLSDGKWQIASEENLQVQRL